MQNTLIASNKQCMCIMFRFLSSRYEEYINVSHIYVHSDSPCEFKNKVEIITLSQPERKYRSAVVCQRTPRGTFSIIKYRES
jgi:hypothetical protein